MNITLGGKAYTKTEAAKTLSLILNSYDISDTLLGEHHMIVLDILQHHPRAIDKIGAGVENFFVRESPVWRGRCFGIKRIDGSEDDFSFKKCLGWGS